MLTAALSLPGASRVWTVAPILPRKTARKGRQALLKIDILKRFQGPKRLSLQVAKLKSIYDKRSRLKKLILQGFAIFSG